MVAGLRVKLHPHMLLLELLLLSLDMGVNWGLTGKRRKGPQGQCCQVGHVIPILVVSGLKNTSMNGGYYY